MKNRITGWALFLCTALTTYAQDTQWPAITTEAKPASRWWWMGSAVDKQNLTHNLNEYAKAGIGTLEITPIYGVQGNDANELPHLSPQWMEMLKHTESEATGLGMQIDMNTGTGWPFGGPDVSIEDAASKLLISEYQITGGRKITQKIEVADEKQKPVAKLSRLMAFGDQCLDITHLVKDGTLLWEAPKGEWTLIAAFCGKTFQKVKRAAPGGEGYVMNHLSANAVKNYLNKFERAFEHSSADYPHNFFNDSYEVYGADWTEDFFDQFAQRKGYKLEEQLPAFLCDTQTESNMRIVADYREVMAELLLENFTRQWTQWANKHKSRTRNQAHGSPGNLIDLYAAVDIPECEGFGLSDFGIRGLRKDSLTRPNDSELSMLKYASSAAHIAGKPYTSSETFTWLTEHFRTSLSQCKPDMDLMFISGVNHCYFHGTTYSPQEAAWPGWKFYASIDMSPTNSIWRDAPAFFSYITRCQSFLQMGKPDNDFLVYLPVHDIWHEQNGRLLLFDIHKMDKRAPKFIDAIHRINNAGYDMDYISDNFILTSTCANGKIVTDGGTNYKAIIIPGARYMKTEVLEKLIELADKGATVVFLEQYPENVPGHQNADARLQYLKTVLAQAKEKGKIIFGTDYAETLSRTNVQPERMKTNHRLSCIRRSNEDGHHYFISALKSEDTDGWVPLATPAQSAMIFDPMSGKSGKALLRNRDGQTEIYLQLASGESTIIKTFTTADVQVPQWKYRQNITKDIPLNDWTFSFIQSAPQSSEASIALNHLSSWTGFDLPNSDKLMGTGLYKHTLTLKKKIVADEDWVLNLGDVRESARIRINGQEVAVLWAVPFRCSIGQYLKKGKNTLEIEVTNLPANRIADLDKQQIPWRKFKEINLVDLNYKKTGYGHWQPMPSGLLGPVKIEVTETN